MKIGIINFHALARFMSSSNWDLKRWWDSGVKCLSVTAVVWLIIRCLWWRVKGKWGSGLKIILLEIHFLHYKSAALNVLHFQLYSGTLYRFSSELPSGMVSVSLAVTTKLSEGKKPETDGTEINFMYFSLWRSRYRWANNIEINLKLDERLKATVQTQP